jgi:DNA-binding transcriptional ArsR family regulator
LLYAGRVHDGLPELSMPNEEQVHLAAEGFRMLADPTRIKILWALLQGESSVTCLAELVGASSTTVSQHLAKLRLAGLVRGRREGTFIYYTAADTHVRALLAEALFHAEHTDRDLGDDSEHQHVLPAATTHGAVRSR